MPNTKPERPVWCRDGDCEIPDKLSLGCFKCGTEALRALDSIEPVPSDRALENRVKDLEEGLDKMHSRVLGLSAHTDYHEEY